MSSGSSDFIELQPGALCDIFHSLLSERDAVLRAARGLLVPARKNRLMRKSNFGITSRILHALQYLAQTWVKSCIRNFLRFFWNFYDFITLYTTLPHLDRQIFGMSGTGPPRDPFLANFRLPLNGLDARKAKNKGLSGVLINIVIVHL